MELLPELILSALIAVLFSFLLAKLVSMAADSSRNPDATEDMQCRDMLQEVDRFQSENRVEFVAEEAQVVAKFVERSVEVDEEFQNSVKNDLAESCELPHEIAEVISGSDLDEFELGFDDHNMKFGMELSAEKDLIIEESDSEAADEKEIKIDSDDEDDDDWEGIEMSELENIFAKATKFMEDEDLTSAGSDVGMELYGLHKIATEGPCREQAPMPLKVAARAKWVDSCYV